MKPQITESVVFIENAVDVWNDLKERYLQGDIIRVAALYQDLSNFKQGNLKVSEYFTEMRALWEEIDQFRPMPQCTCPRPCVFAAMHSARSFKKEDQIIQFLMGLNEQYQTKAEETDVLANSFETGYPNRNSGRGRGHSGYNGGRGRGNAYKEKVCTHCGNNGHIVDICHRKHGYPPGWGSARGNALVNNAGNDAQEIGTNMKLKTDEGSMVITKDQYNSLISLLERNNIDGAKHTSNMVIGESSSCYSAGASGFNINLISVSKLSEQNNCTIVFEDDSCIVQERGTMKRIGLAKLKNGIYYLEFDQVKLNATVHVDSADVSRLWHLRLGHLSLDRTKCLNKTYGYVHDSDHVACA
ncbi:uncharacterized protein LOC131650541 [Vicia villosa]|uniref:uncharacterized protein LOC131650541 n=1 Tax=Vicia villosa TaxID=3911 RepID=UPI00273B3E6F|nr:uncharacterized protein LOC131650541 [Vicia villosa]